MKNLNLFLCMMASCLFLHGCFNTSPREQNLTVLPQDTIFSYLLRGLPVIDLTKNYPEMDFIMDEVDKEFIPLETSANVLADRDFKIEYVSDNRIVGTNRNRGDILIFGRDGKIISYFNHKGKSGIDYSNIVSIVYDEANKEIFVADHFFKNRCAVYSEDGKFLRQFYFPPKSWITELYNFDEQTLLVYNGYNDNKSADDINQKMPYVFLSKKDGKVVSRVDVSLPKRIDDSHITYQAPDEIRAITITPNRNIKYGQELIIADRSSDTVFLFTQDKKLTPLFVRTPSAFDEDHIIVMSVHFKTERYLFF